MGWGLPYQTFNERTDLENQARERLAELVPGMVIRQRAKEVKNEGLLKRVRELMAKDGMEGGFSFLHLLEAVAGRPVEWLPQLIGSCVASGDKETTAARMFAEVHLFNEPESLPGSETSGRSNISFFAPYSYRAGRKLAGINGNGDGSLCVPHIRGKMQFGHLPCDASNLTSDSFPEPQDQAYYRRWGSSDAMLNQFTEVGGKFRLLESEKVRTVDELKTLAVEHHKPANQCSIWAFKRGEKIEGWKTRDGNPVFRWVRDTRAEWAHNLSRMGYVEIGGRWFGIVKNTWGPFHDGRSWFVIDEETDADWIRQSEVQSVGNIDMADSPVVWSN